MGVINAWKNMSWWKEMLVRKQKSMVYSHSMNWKTLLMKFDLVNEDLFVGETGVC